MTRAGCLFKTDGHVLPVLVAILLGDSIECDCERCARGLAMRLSKTFKSFGGGRRGGDEFHGAFLYVAADLPGAHCRAPRNIGSSDEGLHVVPANRVGHGEQLASTNAPLNSIATPASQSTHQHRTQVRSLCQFKPSTPRAST